MTDEPDLLTEVLAFCKRNDLREHRFGELARVGSQFILSLRRGRKCGEKTEAKVRAFMEAYVPPAWKRRSSRIAEKYAATVRSNAAELEAQKRHRATDPVEQAKTFIRAQRYHCFNAEIIRPTAIGMFFIGPRLVDQAGLFAFARKLGWKRKEGGGGDDDGIAHGTADPR